MRIFLRNLPVDGSSNTRFNTSLSTKYCLASDSKSTLVLICLNRGKRSGENIEMEDGPFIKESGS